MKKILLLHGANLNFLGKRDTKHYGKLTLKDIEKITHLEAKKQGYKIVAYQSNHEGNLIDKLQTEAVHCVGIIVNLGAFSHYSYALYDALLDTKLPIVEVHLSNIAKREPWRKKSVTASASIKMISGKKRKRLPRSSPNFSGTYKIMITQKTRLNMVIGFPLAHTQSPLLHNMIYQALNEDAVLLAFSHRKIVPLIQTIKTLSVELTAVTLPFKETVFQYLDHYSSEVKILKTANTIIQRKGKLWGYNTDIDGIAYALRNTEVSGKHVLVIGAGGAARAVGYFLQINKAKLFWLNRTKKKAIHLANVFGGSVIESRQLRHLDIDLIVNTTSLGMYPHANVSPLPSYDFSPEQTVFDLVYNPINTKLLIQARKNKAKTISGLEMFINQGIRQIELWTGKIVNDKLMKRITNVLIAESRTR